MNSVVSGLARVASKLLPVVPILLGVGALAFAISRKQVPEPREATEIAQPLRVYEIRKSDFTPRIVGYGLAEPGTVWNAISRVGGHIEEVHENLDGGSLVREGEVLVRIDKTDYQLRVDQLEADILALKAQITQQETSRDNDEAMLAIEQQSLELLRKDLERQQRLSTRRVTTDAEVEQVERNLLAQERAVQNLKSSLNLVPSLLEQLRSNLKSSQKQLELAKRDLEWTTIEAPFDCLIGAVDLEQGQYVAANQQLFDVYGLEAIDVEARMPLDDLENLVSVDEARRFSGEPISLQSLLTGLPAKVHIRTGNLTQHWSATVTRVREEVDARTRTFGVVVTIKRELPAEGTLRHPPVLKGTFCEVELEGKPFEEVLVVPRTAMRQQQVFVVNAENRLERREVTILVSHGDEILVRGELRAGEQVVLNPPTPAVVGSLVDPVLAKGGESS